MKLAHFKELENSVYRKILSAFRYVPKYTLREEIRTFYMG